MEEMTLEGLPSLSRSCHVAELLAGEVAAGSMGTDDLPCSCL